MSGYKRTINEKITLFILFIIALPFTIFIFLAFILLFILISPFEYPIYRKSLYYKNLKDKYFLTITFKKKYKLYNKVFTESSPHEIVVDENTLKSRKSNDYLLVEYDPTFFKIEEGVITNNIDTNLKIIFTINRDLLSDLEYKSIWKKEHYIVYQN